jgi:plasmid maintenance system antidote protein VapI
MKDIINIKEAKNITQLQNEYDLHKASRLERKLRLMSEEFPEIKQLRQKLRELIKDYEDREWTDLDNITESKLAESEMAEAQIDAEQEFLNRRKNIIRRKLKENEMTQQDLGVLLGHPKSYMSELMNGVSQFTIKDIVIIHRVFGISLKSLVPIYLQPETYEMINASISKLNKPRLRLKKKAQTT